MARCLVCGSEKFTIRRKVAANGASMVACQCDDCGQKIGNWIKHAELSKAAHLYPEWSKEERDRAVCPTCGVMHSNAFWNWRANQ